MDALQRARSLDDWGRAALLLGGAAGGGAGVLAGINSGSPLMALVGAIVGGGVGVFAGYLWALPLVALANVLREIDALRHDR